MHYLTFEPSRKGQLANLSRRDQPRSESPEAAAALAFAIFARCIANWRISFSQQTANQRLSRQTRKSTIPPVAVRVLRPGEAARFERCASAPKRGCNDKTAPPVYADAQKVAAHFPDDPAVQRGLAEAAYDAKDYAAALTAGPTRPSRPIPS